MSIEIPDAAIEAAVGARNELSDYESKHVSPAWLTEGYVARAQLEAALPHLRAAILADLRERCERESALLEAESKCTVSQRRHLASKAEGVRVALSHIGDAERTGQ